MILYRGSRGFRGSEFVLIRVDPRESVAVRFAPAGDLSMMVSREAH